MGMNIELGFLILFFLVVGLALFLLIEAEDNSDLKKKVRDLSGRLDELYDSCVFRNEWNGEKRRAYLDSERTRSEMKRIRTELEEMKARRDRPVKKNGGK